MAHAPEDRDVQSEVALLHQEIGHVREMVAGNNSIMERMAGNIERLTEHTIRAEERWARQEDHNRTVNENIRQHEDRLRAIEDARNREQQSREWLGKKWPWMAVSLALFVSCVYAVLSGAIK